jgi:hypothetical protein
MPFITACSFCPNKLKVPDQSLGASLRCPKCGNYFTVAPAELAPAKPPSRPPVTEEVRAASPPQTSSSAPLPWWVETPPTAAPAPVSPAPPQPLAPPVPAVAPTLLFPEPPRPRPSSTLPNWINAWGVLAFFFAALALLVAAFALARFLSISLAVVGLATGLAGVLAQREEWHLKDSVWLALGGGGSGLLLLLALFAPSWLSVRWGMDFDVPETDRNKQMLVSRDNRTEVKELLSGDRVDAETNAIRQGDIFVRVESAVVERPSEKEQPALVITLHIANVGQLYNVAYHGQASGKHPAVVRDSRGKELQRRDWAAKDKKKPHPLGEVSILPTHEVKDLVVCETPWSGTAQLELDLPAAAWGREGVCRFTISTSFLLHKERSK